MSTPALGPKKVRRLAALCGLDLNGAWSGNAWKAYVRTTDHRHFIVDRKTGEIETYEPIWHWTDCPNE
jgi:hypothetical protein